MLHPLLVVEIPVDGQDDALLERGLGLKSKKSHARTAKVLGMGLFASGNVTPLSRCNILDFVPKSCAKGDCAPLEFRHLRGKKQSINFPMQQQCFFLGFEDQ